MGFSLNDSSLGKLLVEFGTDLTDLDKGLKDAEGKVNATGKKIGVTTTNIANAFLVIGTAAATGIGLAIKTTVDYNEEIFKTSQKTGIAVETLSRLKFVAEQTESSFSDIAVAVRFFQRNIADADDGNKELQKSFHDLGIELRDANGNLTRADEALLTIADRFTQIEDPAKKTALAIQLFGRGGSAIIPILNLGSQGIKRLSDEAEKLGLVLTQENAVAIDNFADQTDALKAAMGGLSIQLAVAVIPALTEFINFTKEAVKQLNPLLLQINEALKSTKTVSEQAADAFSGDDELSALKRNLIEIQSLQDDIRERVARGPDRNISFEEDSQALLTLAQDQLAIEAQIKEALIEQTAQIEEQRIAKELLNETLSEEQIKTEDNTSLFAELLEQSRNFDSQQLLAKQEFNFQIATLNDQQLENFKIFLSQKALLSKEKEAEITAAVEAEIKRRNALEALRQKTIQDGFRIISDATRTFLGESKAAAVILKVLSIGQAIINTAVGVTKALSLGPQGIPLAKVIGVLGAIEVATIAATSFAEGSDNVPVRGLTDPGEIVVPRSFSEAIRQGRLTLGGPGVAGGLDSGSRSVIIEQLSINGVETVDQDSVPDLAERLGRQLDREARFVGGI